MTRWLTLVLLALALTGCTGSARTELEEENRRLTAENSQLAAKNQEMSRRADLLTQENDRLRSQEAELRAELAKGKEASIPADLINPNYLHPTGGTEAWNYRKTATADLDGDGTAERITVVSSAHVDPTTKTVAWDDGHIWHVYVDEPDGTRTVLFANWVQLGRLDVGVAMDGRSLILQQGGGWYTLIYRATYNGPNQVDAVELLSLELKEKAAFPPGKVHQE